MPIIHNFSISPEEYHRRGVKNIFPVVEACPCCLYPKKLKRHAFYQRYVISFNEPLQIFILRFKCTSCGKTFAILPDFILPYFQYSLESILYLLKGYFLWGRTKIYYQLLQFYRRRFLGNLNKIAAFFRDKGYKGVISEKGKAIKLLKMIDAFPKAKTFAKRFYNHFNQNFMAD